MCRRLKKSKKRLRQRSRNLQRGLPELPVSDHHKGNPVLAARHAQALPARVDHVHKEHQVPDPINKYRHKVRDRSRESLNLDQDLKDLAVLVHPQINQVPSKDRRWQAPILVLRNGLLRLVPLQLPDRLSKG